MNDNINDDKILKKSSYQDKKIDISGMILGIVFFVAIILGIVAIMQPTPELESTPHMSAVSATTNSQKTT